MPSKKEEATALILLSVCFIVGSLCGSMLSAFSGGSGRQALAAYIQSRLEHVAQGGALSISPAAVLWGVLRWPLLILLLSVTPAGLVGLPVLFWARGLLLSFAATSFTQAMGGPGRIFALIVLGIPAIPCVPALFVLGVQGLDVSRRMTHRILSGEKRAPIFQRHFLLRSVLCLSFCLFGAALDRWAVPALVGVLANDLL